MVFLHQSCFCTCRPQPGSQPFNKYLVTVQNHCLNYVWKTVAASFYCIQTYSTYHHKQPNIKGQVHPELKIRPLSVHPHADGKSRKVSELTKHFWSYTTKLRCNIHLNSWGICGLGLCANIQLIWPNSSLFKYILDVRSSGDLVYIGQGFCSHYSFFLVVFFNMLQQVPICLSCSGERCISVLQWSSRNVMWTDVGYKTSPSEFDWALQWLR